MTEIRASPSLLSLMSKCGYAAYRRYVLGIRGGPPDPPRIVGSAVHRAYARDLSATAARAPFDDADYQDLAADSFEFEWSREGEVLLAGDDAGRNPERVRADAKAQALQMSGVVRERVTKRTQVDRATDVEIPFDLRIAGSDVRLVGRLDGLERARRRIRELKVWKSKPKPADLEGSIQADFYALALQKTLGDDAPTAFRMDVAVKNKTPKVWRIDSECPTDHTALLGRVAIVRRAFETGVFYPADPTGPSGWICSANYCEHYEDCPYGRRRAKAVPVATMEEVR